MRHPSDHTIDPTILRNFYWSAMLYYANRVELVSLPILWFPTHPPIHLFGLQDLPLIPCMTLNCLILHSCPSENSSHLKHKPFFLLSWYSAYYTCGNLCFSHLLQSLFSYSRWSSSCCSNISCTAVSWLRIRASMNTHHSTNSSPHCLSSFRPCSFLQLEPLGFLF